jgi:iron complex outermembrane recepter protein
MVMIHAVARRGRSARAKALSTASAIALLATTVAGAEVRAQATPPVAQSAQESASIDEIIVTGSRVVRDGYEAPTPVTVVGIEQIEAAAPANVADYVNQMPAFGIPQNTRDGGSGVSAGRIGSNNLNLRALGTERTLTLLNGHRIVGASPAGAANVNDFPQHLISRVDVVTGGASSAYGSDAIAGVANFILDTGFTGIKGQAQGSISTYGDNRTLQASLASGTPFAGGRGHLLLSGEWSDNPGVHPVSVREWNLHPTKIMANPAYTATNGQPQFLLRHNVGNILTAPGGVIFSGPLKGITFNQDGEPFQFPYGILTSSPYTVYPDGVMPYSDPTRYGQSLEDSLLRTASFVRLSYDVADNVNVYFQFLNSFSRSDSNVQLDESYQGSPGTPVRLDNAFLPASVRQMMLNAGVTQIAIGTYNWDLPPKTGLFKRRVWSYAVGANGSFETGDTRWTWDAQAQLGLNRTRLQTHVMQRSRKIAADDAVFDAQGKIVCRINVDTNPNNNDPACVPWNLFGWGNNTQAAIDYVKGNKSNLIQVLNQDVYSVSVSGEPFSTWAGPVSVAFGGEHRKEAVDGIGDPIAEAGDYNTANYRAGAGSYTVKEAFFEAVIPLATDTEWARSLEFNGAVRATDYSLSGYVTTWKIGATYQPVDDIRFRVTRSRDIRAPNLEDLFAGATTGRSSGIVDPFKGNITVNGVQSIGGGSVSLSPEKADTTGIGLVFQPTFLVGFQASVDLYDIDIGNAISSVSVQNAINLCFEGRTEFCKQAVRDSDGNLIAVSSQPLNFLSLKTRGFDIEASYRTPLSAIVDSWEGDITVRALATHVKYLRQDTGFSFVTDAVGNHGNQGTAVPEWRYNFSLNYSRDALRVTYTGRGLPSGHYQSNYIVCTSGCPASTPSVPTIDNAHIEGRFYHDVSATYEFMHEEEHGVALEAYFSVSNLLNTDPPPVALTSYFHASTNPGLFDTIGRNFRGGIRFRM